MTLHEHLARVLAEPVSELTQVGGGDINDTYRAALASGRLLFVKTHPRPLPGMYAREAEGLAYLAEARALPTPRVIAVDEALLVLEFIPTGPRRADFDELLGRGLATLHRAGAPCFGLAIDNFIGSLPQSNRPHPRWADFYRHERLAPLVARAALRGTLQARDQKAFDALYARLEGLVGDDEPPARLHGDLWSGNVYTDAGGRPVLIDPAVYGGHREVDLAMLQLFGSPSARFFAAYDEAHPRASGADERVGLYQLYPLLVHVNLFGAGYVSSLRRTLARYVG